MAHVVVTLTFIDGPPTPDVAGAQKEFLERLRADGLLGLTGGFTDGVGGMAVLRGLSPDEVETRYRDSPIVRAGQATVAVREWNIQIGAIA